MSSCNMKTFTALFAWLVLATAALAQVPMTGAGVGAPTGGGGGGCSPGTHAAAFLAVATGMDQTHQDAFCNLINGLDTDATFSSFDAIYVFATDTNAHALLDLTVTHNATANGSPAFSANNGYTGVDASSTVYISAGFNPQTSMVKFAQNSAHVSVWNLTNSASGASGGAAISSSTTGTNTRIFPKYSDGKFRGDVTATATTSLFTISDPRGWLVSTRASSSTNLNYQNASLIETVTSTSAASGVQTFTILANNFGGTISFGGAYQIAIATIGSDLTSGQVTSVYNRFCTYMTTIHGSC